MQPIEAQIAAPFAVLAGIAATTAALGVSELVAGLLGAQSLVAAVGGFVIANQPPGAKDFVVALFGQNDKVALQLLIVAVALVVGAGLGLLARRWLHARRRRHRRVRRVRVRGRPRRPVRVGRAAGDRRRGRCHGRHLDAVVAHRPGPGRSSPPRAREEPRSACRTGLGAVS